MSHPVLPSLAGSQQYIQLVIFFCDTQYQGSARPDLDHQDRDWKCLSLNGETESEKVWVSMTRPRLKMSQYQWQDQNRDLKGLSLNDETETEID